jgi:hypothetical protein
MSATGQQGVDGGGRELEQDRQPYPSKPTTGHFKINPADLSAMRNDPRQYSKLDSKRLIHTARFFSNQKWA